MALDVTSLVDRVESLMLASGWFESVNFNEPKNPPGNGLRLAIWAQDIVPERQRSGLSTTAARVVLNLRVYSNMMSDPQDAIDPEVMRAVDNIYETFTGTFKLMLDSADDFSDANVDLMGMTARAGYITISQVSYRVMTVTLPIVINDVWTQAP